MKAMSMSNWFLENYEDPSNHVRFESSEGGYQYDNGGPYDAEEELREQFSYATDSQIEKALKLLEEHGGPEWVRIGEYP